MPDELWNYGRGKQVLDHAGEDRNRLFGNGNDEVDIDSLGSLEPKAQSGVNPERGLWLRQPENNSKNLINFK